jgi:hypothetical protein
MTVTSAPEQTRFTTEVTCPRCGSSADGKYCANCGTRLTQRRDLSVKHYLREVFAAITDIDSVFIGTFRTLLARPGRLSTEYLHGDRHRYLQPFRVFLLCNVVYFLFATQYGSTVLTTSLRGQVGEMMYRSVTRPVLEQRYHITLPPRSAKVKEVAKAIPPDLEKRYDSATEELGKTILVVLIPAYALVMALMFAGMKRYFVEHLVFATHYMSFFLLALPGVVLGIAGYAMLLTLTTGHRFTPGGVMFAALQVVLLLYVYAAQREFYQSRKLPALVRGAVVAWSFTYMVVGFKLLLFFVTLFWIGH